MEPDLTPPFDISFEWLDRDHGSAVDRATLAQIQIRVGDECATHVEDVLAKTVRPFIRASAHTLAVWLAANWWRLRWEPEPATQDATTDWLLSHNLAGAGEGYVWPSLLLASDGFSVTARAEPSRRTQLGPVHYLSRFQSAMSASDFEDGVDRFLEAVIERTARVTGTPSELAALWSEVGAERRDPEASAWRRIEARLGFDPDAAPDGLIEQLVAVRGEIGEGALEEVAADAKERTPQVLRDLMDAQPRATPLRVPDAPPVSSRFGAVPAWKAAVESARTAREAWGLGTEPLANATLADVLGMNPGVLAATDPASGPMPAGFRADDGSLSVLLSRSSPADRRFALARLVGDSLATPDDRLLPATRARTYRQKFQRAFAQEFLAPYVGLEAFFGSRAVTDEEVEDAARHFNVSPLVVGHALENNRYASAAGH